MGSLATMGQCLHGNSMSTKKKQGSTMTKMFFLANFLAIVINAQEKKENPLEENEGEELSEDMETRHIAYAAMIVVTILIALSILFEKATEHILEETDEMNMPFINTIFSELTTLGFIGLLLFILSKLHFLSSISTQYLGEAETLQETIEKLHMILFMFVGVFLTLCLISLRLGMSVQQEWREFERRSYDMDKIVEEYVLATEPFESKWDYLDFAKVRRMFKAKRELTYVSLRSRFVDSRAGISDAQNADAHVLSDIKTSKHFHFPFNEYLSIISGETMGRLIEIDVVTWSTLEVVILVMSFCCYSAGEVYEPAIMLIAGFVLILLNFKVYDMICKMRISLTPALLKKKAEILRHQPKWRALRGLAPMLPKSLNFSTSESQPLLGPDAEVLTHEDYLPPFIQTLPNQGLDLDPSDAAARQKKLLTGSGNGVLAALFCTRMVFLLSAMHFSVFITRVAAELVSDSRPWVAAVASSAFLLPSVFVAVMSTRISRDGLYCFNVEFMKVPRVQLKVMRILKARQTLRTLRFVAEMKVLLRDLEEEDEDPAHGQLQPIVLEPTTTVTGITSILSPRSAENQVQTKPRQMHAHNVGQDQYKLEQERREINSIFCLFDSDASGSISEIEMETLLKVISHDLHDDQIRRIMRDMTCDDTNGEISFDEFYRWCTERIRSSRHSSEELIREVFQMVDQDASGSITVEEFIAIFKTLGQSLDHDDVREIVYQADLNNDGQINLEEFSKILRKHAL